MEACMNLEIKVEDFAEKTGYHAYDPTWGFGFFNVFVCLITQFLHALVEQSPAGSVAWFTTMIVFLPVNVLITLEAGRRDAKGPVRYPLIVDVLNQIFGVSVLFPLVWVPSYIWGHGEGGLSQTRIYASVPIALPRMVLSIVIFWLLPTSSSWWTSCAAIVGGPAVCLPLALLHFVQDPDPTVNNVAAVQTSAEKSTMSYAVAGVISLAAWLWLVFIVTIPQYGFSLSAIYKDVWEEANPAVAFMTIDAIVLWLGLIVFIAYHKLQFGLEALALSFLFGPGAGPALVWAGIQVDDEAQLKWAIIAQRKADEEEKKNE
jgi:hypothetical protein